MILSAGLTPAWQQVLVFDTFQQGEVNRARQVHWCASGKVLNAARALHHLGVPSRALTVVGGTPGEAIRRDSQRQGIAARWIAGTAPTRVCTTILNLSQRQATELVPNAEGITATEQSAFLAAYAEEAASAEVVILIGSLPAGTPSTFYRDLIARSPGKVVLDARGAELQEALSAEPFLVKPNRDELGRTFGRALSTDEALFAAMAEVNRLGAAWVVITDGRKPVYARSSRNLYRLQPAAVEVVNPIGCGDCMAAGIAWGVEQGWEPLDAIRLGAAAAADKLGRLLPGELDRGRVQALAGDFHWELVRTA